jgi:threonine dehydrogenase-like Zn-dependent dehydrogenase
MRSTFFLVIILTLAPLFAPAQNADQPRPSTPEQYAATAFITSGAAQGKSVSVTIYINSFTTDEEVENYLDILKTKGQDGLESAFDKTRERGRIAIVGTTGNDISFIRSRTAETKRIITMAANRTISFPELRESPRSRDYKFTIIELRLDADGKGDGTLMYATKLKFNKKGQLELEHYGQTPVRLANVRREK